MKTRMWQKKPLHRLRPSACAVIWITLTLPGNIYADEKAAAYMKNSGLFDQTWTISISGEEWFHMKIVTDEEINKMTKSATTYAF